MRNTVLDHFRIGKNTGGIFFFFRDEIYGGILVFKCARVGIEG